jgi:hypothetical protein
LKYRHIFYRQHCITASIAVKAICLHKVPRRLVARSVWALVHGVAKRVQRDPASLECRSKLHELGTTHPIDQFSVVVIQREEFKYTLGGESRRQGMHAARPFFEGLDSSRADNEGVVGRRGEQMATSLSPPSPAPIACLTHLTSSKQIELLLLIANNQLRILVIEMTSSEKGYSIVWRALPPVIQCKRT